MKKTVIRLAAFLLTMTTVLTPLTASAGEIPEGSDVFAVIQAKTDNIKADGFSADSLTIQPGETTASINPNFDGASENPNSKQIDAFTVSKNTDGGKKIIGEENGSASLDMTQIGRYDSGMTNPDGGVMEITDYSSQTGWAYAINGQAGLLTAISLKTMEQKDTVDILNGNNIDIKTLVNADGFTYGDMTSVAVSPDGTKLAAAIQAEGYAENGRIALFTCEADGALSFECAFESGVQPDMVTFTPDGTKILAANEGEPRKGYDNGAVDPQGSVTLINLSDDMHAVKTVDFTGFDSAEQRSALVSSGIVLKKGANPSDDFEPEYIAATNDKAYVTLQEANAVAVLDLDSSNFTGIYSAGFEDYSKTPVDIDKKDEKYEPKTYESLCGIRMPDAVSLYQSGGKTYLLTANEGDSREWGDYLNETERNFKDSKETSPAGKITAENSGLSGKVVFFDPTDYDGLDAEKDYLFGGRSFTLFEVSDTGLKEIFDSGSDFESKTAEYLPNYFNCSNDDLTIDDRSGKKGPEPETVTVGKAGDKTYAFVTLERIGGVMAYDITDPSRIKFSNYINSRDFNVGKDQMGFDNSPEGLKFIPASESPTGEALLMAACEVGGTVAVYELQTTAKSDSGNSDSGGSSGDSDSDSDNGRPEKPGKPENPPKPIILPFHDVAADSRYYDSVAYVYEKGLMNGTDDESFHPDDITTRGMIVTILYRLENNPDVSGSSFLDVASGAYCTDAVAWASANGIVNGYSHTKFGPDDTVTREQIATILYRYADYKSYNVDKKSDLSGFSDSNTISSYAATALSWANAEGLITGTDGETLNPKGSAVRAQTAAILARFCRNYE